MHPLLELVLEGWRESGFEQSIGWSPQPDDSIVPSKGGMSLSLPDDLERHSSPMMLARLLLAVAASDAETELSGDLARARRLATLVGAPWLPALARMFERVPEALNW